MLAIAGNSYIFNSQVAATRPATDYTVRVIPRCDSVAIPLEDTRILWRRWWQCANRWNGVKSFWIWNWYMDAEQQRILQNAGESRPWQQWGSYLSERQWGTVREDYSPCYWAQKAGGGYRKIEEVKSLSELIAYVAYISGLKTLSLYAYRVIL